MLKGYVQKFMNQVHCNIRGINADIFVLTETWLNVEISDEELEFFGYNMYRMDRCNRTSVCKRGDGVAICVLCSQRISIRTNKYSI